jgi:hypothetical protein
LGATVGDIVSEVLPHLETFLSDHFLMVFPAGDEKELQLYYRDLVAEISCSEWRYLYSVRPTNTLAYTALGSERELITAIQKVWSVMEALYSPAVAA